MSRAEMDVPAVEPKSQQQGELRKLKRSRVALACHRCRTRKQKCNGARDSCSTCRALGLMCYYKPQLTPRPDQKKVYIGALEDRVAELESILAGLGHETVSHDHWRGELQFQYDGRASQPDDYVVASGDVENASSSPGLKPGDGNPTLSLGSVFNSVIQTRKSSASHVSDEEESPKSIPTSELMESMGRMFLSPATASILLDGWVKYLSTQYPVIHTPRLRELHARRDDSLDVYEESMLHLIYANSGRVLEVMGNPGPFYRDQHYEAAIKNLDTILELGDARPVAFLLLLALYCLNEPKDPGAWTLAGLAVRLCIELGMHRKTRMSGITMATELNVRIFWSCYYLDRGVSVALGRPPAIADDDIDVELPIDIDEEVDDLERLQSAADNSTGDVVRSPSSLATFIHLIKLRRIESKIEQVMYRAKRQKSAIPTVVQGFLHQLILWKEAIPSDYHRVDTETAIGMDNFMIPFNKVVRLLLYPLLSERELNLYYLKTCAEASAEICRAYKRQYLIHGVDCSPFAIQSLFLSGLTLLYCMWLAPRNCLDVVGAISDCNVILYVIAERYPSARKYRDVFDRTKTCVIDAIAKETHESARATGILDNEMTEQCRALDEGLTSTVRTDYSQIISNLAKDRQEVGLGTRPNPSSWHIRDLFGEKGPTPGLNFSFPAGNVMGDDLGHSHGTFIDTAFIDNLGDLNGLMSTDWNVSASGSEEL